MNKRERKMMIEEAVNRYISGISKERNDKQKEIVEGIEQEFGKKLKAIEKTLKAVGQEVIANYDNVNSLWVTVYLDIRNGEIKTRNEVQVSLGARFIPRFTLEIYPFVKREFERSNLDTSILDRAFNLIEKGKDDEVLQFVNSLIGE